MRVNWKDFLERVGWTAIQATAAAALVVLTTSDIDWETGLKFVGTAVAIAVAKVVIAQQVGDSKTGDAFPGGVK